MAKRNFGKDYKTPRELVTFLENRGLIINNSQKANCIWRALAIIVYLRKCILCWKLQRLFICIRKILHLTWVRDKKVMKKVGNLAIFLYIYIWLSTSYKYYNDDCQRKNTEIFCIADDFCKEFDVEIAKLALQGPDGIKHRKRKCRMRGAEIMTSLISFHFNDFRNFKHYYLVFSDLSLTIWNSAIYIV